MAPYRSCCEKQDIRNGGVGEGVVAGTGARARYGSEAFARAGARGWSGSSGHKAVIGETHGFFVPRCHPLLLARI